MDMYFYFKFIEEIIWLGIFILCCSTCAGIVLWSWIKQKIKEWKCTRGDEKRGDEKEWIDF